MILGNHLLLDHVISVPYSYLALIYITWAIDFAVYLWLYLQVPFHTASDLIFFVGHCTYVSWSSDFALYLRPYQLGRHDTSGICSVLTLSMSSHYITVTYISWTSDFCLISLALSNR